MKLFSLILISVLIIPFYSTKAVASDITIKQLPNNPSLRGSAIVEDIAWVTGSNNSVFITKDKGETWLDVSVKDELTLDFRDIAVFDKNTAIVMSVGTGDSSRLYITNNQGQSWELLYQNPDEQGFFDSIAFWDRNNGLLLGDPVDGFYVILKTSDGGKTWQRIERQNIPAMLKNEAAFAASGHTLIVGKDGKAAFTTGGFDASVYTSENYGNNWQRRRVPIHNSAKTAGGYGLAFNSLEQLFVVGGDYEHREMPYRNIAMLTRFAWKSPKAPMVGLRTAMSCSNAVCLATGKLFTDISTDHGQSWQNLPINGKNQGFYTLTQQNGNFVAAGHDGRVSFFNISALINREQVIYKD